MTNILLVCVAIYCLAVVAQAENSYSQAKVRSPGEITKNYQPTADRIRDYLVTGSGKSDTYLKLSNLTDLFGPRVSTSDAYKDAAEFLFGELKSLPGVTRVWKEEVTNIPVYTRGKNRASIVMPVTRRMAVLAIGKSPSTPPGGLTARVVVVRSFGELDSLLDVQLKDKIVVFNQEWNGYKKTSDYRNYGPERAAKRGAAAVLIRSITPLSLYTLHVGETGSQDPSIPSAAITIEDAEMLYRMQEAGDDLRVHLELEGKIEATSSSNTIIAEIEGSTLPKEMVVFGAHLDSVDVGQGALDDGAGVAITWQALATLGRLNLRPKRTLRAVFWTAHEQGKTGALAYYEKHKSEAASISLVAESDSAVLKPVGVHFTGSDEARAIMQQVADLLAPINGNLVATDGVLPGDAEKFVIEEKVPGVELYSDDAEKYYWYHHSHADTMTAIDSDQLDRAATIWTTIAYVSADLDNLLPRAKINQATTINGSQLSLMTTALAALLLKYFWM